MARAETGKQTGQSGDADQGEIGTQTSSLIGMVQTAGT